MSHRIGNKFKILAVAVAFVAAAVLLLASACTAGATTNVSFSGGSSFAGDAVFGGEYREGETITLPGCSMTRDGYVFHAWTDGEREYFAGDRYVVGTGGITFVAVWKKEKLSATFFEADGVTLIWEKKDIPYGKGLPFGYLGNDPTPPESEIAGKAYVWDPTDGWNPSIPSQFTDDMVFTAKFSLEDVEYRASFLDEDGSSYGYSSGKYGEPIVAPRNPEKEVPIGEIHVERYEFKGWKPVDAPAADAVMPDSYGSIGVFVENGRFEPVFEKVMKQYTLVISEQPEGANVAVSGSTSAGGMFEITVTTDKAHNRSTPTATAEFAGAYANVVLRDLGQGVWKGVIDNVTGSGTVRVAGVTLNRYRVTAEAEGGTIAGLAEDYAHGGYAEFTVAPGAHYSQSTPVVTINGSAVSGSKEIVDGAPVYRYRTEKIVDDLTVKAVGTKNEYKVTLVYGDGSTEVVPVMALEYFALPERPTKDNTAEFEYSFLNWTETTGAMSDEYRGGAAVPIEGDREFKANFKETRRSYTVTFLTRGEEKTILAEYGTPIAEIAAGFELTIRETAETYTFVNWEKDGAAVAPGAVVEGAGSYTAQYDVSATRYTVTFRYQKDGIGAKAEVLIPYGTTFGTIEKPDADDLTGEGKYLVWRIGGKDATAGTVVTGDAEFAAEYRIYRYEVRFSDRTGQIVPEWTVTVDWGTGATEPPIVKNDRDERNIYTFTVWSKDFSNVKEDMTVRAEFKTETRYYAVNYRSEKDAEFIDTTGDATYDSEATFRVKLADRIDPDTVTVYANGTALTADERGVYTFRVIEDTEVWLTGADTKYFRVEYPVSETFTVEPIDSAVVVRGEAFRFRVNVGAAYSESALRVLVGGVVLEATDGVYTILNVKENLTIEIPDLTKNVYEVKAIAGEGIERVEADRETVEYGDAVTFTVTLREGYSAKGLLYETTLTGLSVSASGNVYTVVAPRVTERAEIKFYGEINVYRVEIAGQHFTTETAIREVTHGQAFEAEIVTEAFYDRQIPEADYAGATVTAVGKGRFTVKIAVVTEDATIIVTPKRNVYTVTVNAGTGVLYEGGAVEVRHGSAAEIAVKQAYGYTDAPPAVTATDGKTVTVAERDGNWILTAASVEDDLIIDIAGTPNVYPMTLPTSADAEAGGYTLNGETSAAFGSDYEFRVTLDASRNRTAPVVTMDGAGTIDSFKTEGDVYTFRIEAVEKAHRFTIETKVNVYTVTFLYPDETVTRALPHAAAVSAPEDLREHYNENSDAGTAQYLTGWTRDGKAVAADFAGETALGDQTYAATAATRYFTAKIGSTAYLYVETALEAAKVGDTIDIVRPGSDAGVELGGQKQVTLDRPGDKKTYELPTGVTLRLPYNDNNYSDFGDNDKRFNTAGSWLNHADNNENLYLNLEFIIPHHYTMLAYGEIQIGGVLSSQSQGRQGQTSSYYAQLTVDGTLNINGTLKTFGYVKGSGEVYAKSASKVYQPFVVNDFKGGGHTKGAYEAGVSPFNVFNMPNIAPNRFIIEYGAYEYGYAVLWTSTIFKQYNRTEALVVAPDTEKSDSVIKIGTGGRLVNTFSRLKNPRNEIETVTNIRMENGSFTEGAIVLKIKVIVTVTVTTSTVLLPISYLYRITVADTAEFTIKNKYKLLPGSRFEVEKGGKVILQGQAAVYDNYDPTGSTLSTYEYNQFYANNMSPAEFIINGSFEVKGSAAFGGNIKGNGLVTFASDASTSVVSDEYSKNGNSGVLTKFFTTSQTARGTVGGVETAFAAGNSYSLS